jgi:toxin CptA
MGGVDLSWLAGGVVSAAVYAALGPIVARKYAAVPVPAAAPAPRRPAPVEATAALDLPETPGVTA